MADRPVYGAKDGHGRYGILDHDDEGRLLCHECGRWWKHLGTHAAGTHGLSAARYREAHGLGMQTVLIGAAVRARMSQGWERNREVHLASIQRHRDPARARAASAASRQDRPETVARKQAVAASRKGRDLTPQEIVHLGDETDLRAWADRARTLLGLPGVTIGSIGRAVTVETTTVRQRLRRYPAGPAA